MLFFFYQAPNAPMMARAKSGSHKTTVEHVMLGSHIQFQIGHLSELSEAEIVRTHTSNTPCHCIQRLCR